MDLARLARDTAGTNSAAHMRALHEHGLKQFSHDQNIQDIMWEKVRAQQTMMMRNYVHKFADSKRLLRELDDVLRTFGKTGDDVDACVCGVVRSAQTEIYALCAAFDTDDFRFEHMGDASGPAKYCERASAENTWRSIIDVEALKIVAVAAHRLGTMRARAAELSAGAFAALPEYAAWVAQPRSNSAPTEPAWPRARGGMAYFRIIYCDRRNKSRIACLHKRCRAGGGNPAAMSRARAALDDTLMFIQTVEDGFLRSFLVHVDPERHPLIHEDLVGCGDIGMAVKISLPRAGYPEGNELIQEWTKFCYSQCVDANHVETSALRLPDIAKARWWAMYSYV